MIRSIPLPQLCHCLRNCLKGLQGRRLLSLFQCFLILTASKIPTVFIVCVSLAARQGHRMGYCPSVQQSLTRVKIVIIPVSVVSPSLSKILLLFLQGNVSLYPSCSPVIHCSNHALAAAEQSWTCLCRLCAVLHFMPKHCRLGFLAVAYFYLSACACRLPSVRIVLKNSFEPVCPHFVCLCNEQE